MKSAPHEDQHRSTEPAVGGRVYDRKRHGLHNLQRAEVIADPHRYIRQIQELGPVFYDETSRVWVCTGYEESVKVLTRHAIFSSARLINSEELQSRGLGEAADVVGMLQKQLIFKDPPAHTAVREALREHFSGSRVRAWSHAMQDIVRRALAGLPAHGTADIIADFAANLSSPLIAALLGMEGRESEISRWADAYEALLGSVSALPDIRDKTVIPVLTDALAALQAAGRGRMDGEQEDLLSALVRAGRPHELDKSGVDEHLYEVAANCVVLAGGGYQTLTHLVSTGLRLFDRHPEQQRLLREDPDLIDSAVNEILRLDGSSQYLARRVTQTTLLGGHEIAAGQSVLVHLGAANVDPRKFTDPLSFDIRRREARHLGFGLGRHYCIGAPYAERLAGIAILQFLDKYSDYSFDGDSDALRWGPHANTRCLASAPVRLGRQGDRPADSASPSRPAYTHGHADRQRSGTPEVAATLRWSGTVRGQADHDPWHVKFSEQAKLQPDRIAVEAETEALTYRELDRRSNTLAYQLRSFGVQPETVVAIVMERRTDFVCAVLAVAKAGGSFVLADVTCPRDRLAGMLEESKSSLVLTDAASFATSQAFSLRTPTVVVSTSPDHESAPVTGVNVGNTAYVVFTSGSTGRPKAIAISHEGVSNLHEGLNDIFRLSPTDRVLQFLSPNFDGCISDIVLALLSGATLVFADNAKLQVGPPLAMTLKDRRITSVIMTPSVWSSLPYTDLPDLRIGAAAGERLASPIVRKWRGRHRRFLNIYGPAEAAALTAWHECGDSDDRPPIGRPATNKRVYVLDGDRPVPVGEEGELCIGGIGLGRYINRPELMEERFATDAFVDRPGQLIYRTGDRCRWRPDGTLDFIGRADRQVKIRGHRIELNEVENVIAEFPQVSACTVYEAEGQLRASVVVAEGTLDEEALRRFLSPRLYPPMIPTEIQQVEDSGRTINGKADWQIPQVSGRDNRFTGSDPGTPTLQAAEHPDYADTAWNQARVTWAVAQLFAQCLRLPLHRVKDQSDFYSLGGDSLSTAELFILINERFGVSIRFESLLDRCTPEGLAEEILQQAPSQHLAPPRSTRVVA
ncbi:amino acid adenylation domain-containing protein [Micromonospora sp. NPDC050276]|uniref:amino acid adenylation domain-containing protein n=1 Tax=Micromonospora sp. NPDC050276 TaxID=3364278 RepID=UPI0037991C3B